MAAWRPMADRGTVSARVYTQSRAVKSNKKCILINIYCWAGTWTAVFYFFMLLLQEGVRQNTLKTTAGSGASQKHPRDYAPLYRFDVQPGNLQEEKSAQLD
ncbi:hypothetical protein NDU88_004942 [Pleurodeles waltl]|uniref:Uncharacterized protein n=1 Tax=Pleurodeles waltl TaxID=8319 RepID=A0AAV7PHG2_PLEWA|nr:hypothetical protein NDU88_004942 [Pleurodeles waltl]